MNVLDIISAPWAITPSKLEQIREAYYARVRGEESEWLAKGGPVQSGTHVPYTVEDGIATINVSGVIAQRANLMTQISGGTSSQMLSADFDRALADPMVDAIVFAIDSPGGIVSGTPELAAKVFAARGQKPIASWTDSRMLSAAYWIGSAADQVFVSSNVTEVGSIGIVVAHRDISQAEAKEGVKTTEIYAGKYKRIATSHAPLSEEGKAHIQEMVDYIYHGFVGAVATHRGAPVEEVLNRMAEGRVHIGKQAIAAGLVDGTASLDEVKAKLRNRVAVTRSAPTSISYQETTVMQEIRQPQARARDLAGPSRTSGNSPVAAVPYSKLSREEQLNACTAEFNGNKEIRDEFGSVGLLAAWRAAEASGNIRIVRGPAPMQSTHKLMADARRRYAENPALQSAFGSERLYVAHCLADGQI